MATTSSLGIGTGVDLQSMLSSIVAAERAPITALDTKIATTKSSISLYGSIKSKLDALQSAAETLQFPSRLSALTASSSDATVVSASADFTAAVGTYSTEVTQLAKAQKSFTNTYNSGTTFGSGTLQFTVAGSTAATINISDGSTLQDVGQAINNAQVGVTATVITDSTGKQRMVLTGDKSGASNGFSLVSTSSASGGQSALDSFDTTTTSLNRSAAQDALMTLDGISVSSSTNTFTNTVTGLTLTAVKTGTSNITVSNEASKITSAAQAFVDSYNAVVSLIKSNSGVDATTNVRQILSGDSTARSVISSLGNIRTSVPTELSSAAFKTLSQLGISIEKTGLLSLDTTTLTAAIKSSSTEVVKSLNAYGKAFATKVAAMQESDGVVTSQVNSLDATVKRYEDNQAALEVKVSIIEKRYRAQFTSLDKLISTMKTTSSYLTQQLSSLS